MKKNIAFNIKFNNVPNSMLIAMAKMEIGDITEQIEIDFNKEENISLFAELCSIFKVRTMEERIKELVHSELDRLITKQDIY
jgi:hypothetical protein